MRLSAVNVAFSSLVLFCVMGGCTEGFSGKDLLAPCFDAIWARLSTDRGVGVSERDSVIGKGTKKGMRLSE